MFPQLPYNTDSNTDVKLLFKEIDAWVFITGEGIDDSPSTSSKNGNMIPTLVIMSMRVFAIWRFNRVVLICLSTLLVVSRPTDY